MADTFIWCLRISKDSFCNIVWFFFFFFYPSYISEYCYCSVDDWKVIKPISSIMDSRLPLPIPSPVCSVWRAYQFSQGCLDSTGKGWLIGGCVAEENDTSLPQQLVTSYEFSCVRGQWEARMHAGLCRQELLVWFSECTGDLGSNPSFGTVQHWGERPHWICWQREHKRLYTEYRSLGPFIPEYWGPGFEFLHSLLISTVLSIKFNLFGGLSFVFQWG